MYGASDRRSVSAGHFRSNDLLEARESARAGNELFEITQIGCCRRAQRACNINYYPYYRFPYTASNNIPQIHFRQTSKNHFLSAICMF